MSRRPDWDRTLRVATVLVNISCVCAVLAAAGAVVLAGWGVCRLAVMILGAV